MNDKSIRKYKLPLTKTPNTFIEIVQELADSFTKFQNIIFNETDIYFCMEITFIAISVVCERKN